MSAIVNVGPIVIGGASNGVGVFNGQNMQNDWDSHAPNISTLGPMMGNSSAQWSMYAALWINTAVGQPTFDQDFKANNSPMWIGV